MAEYPFGIFSLTVFAGIFNLMVALIMLYLRSRGGTRQYTKSQLWALTILGFLFLENFMLLVLSAYQNALIARGMGYSAYEGHILWTDLTMFTAFLLLAFGMVYPRPLARWSKLKVLLLLVLMVGLVTILVNNATGHRYLRNINPHMDLTIFIYTIAVFVPVFIWISEYSRQPSKEGRMMYTIFIWGFLFVIVTSMVHSIVYSISRESRLGFPYVVNFVLVVLALIKMLLAIRRLRRRWSSPETVHVIMIILSLTIAVGCALLKTQLFYWSDWHESWDPRDALYFLTNILGWALVRPILFSYGLLRYRLMGSQIRAERLISVMGSILASSFVFIFILNLTGGYDSGPLLMAGALFLSVILLVPFHRMIADLVTRLLPMSAGAREVSMRERRNTYLIGLQTGVVKGQITDEEDRAALERLRKALGVTEREHQLLLRSIAQQEAHRTPGNEVEEVYLLLKDGRLLSHYLAGDGVEGSKGAAGKDRDVVAGMFAAVSDYVREAMRSQDDTGRMDTISYGGSQLVIESEGNIVMAVVLRTADDLVVRQVMRDFLSEINEDYAPVFTDRWDGDRAQLEGLDRTLVRFVEVVEE